MADSMILSSEFRKPENGLSVDSAKDPLFQRKIEFHIARKQFNPYNSASGDFRLETLNPNVDPQRPYSSTAGGSSGKKSEGGTEALEHGLDLDFSFGMTVRRIVKCMQCSYSSNKFDPFLDLSLEIMKADSLRKALAHFTAVEQLDGGEKQYQCQHCKEKVRALKQLTVHKAPMILTIHLKRFGSHNPGHKIDKKIEFAPYLDLKPFVSDPHEGDYKYHLYGVLVHAGWSTHSGHYYCFVCTSSGLWYSLDDNRVVQVSEKRVLEQQAYMLFYTRDRRNPAPKKTNLDVARSGNLAPSATLNKSVLNYKEEIQNGQMERKVTVPDLFNELTSASHGQSTSTVETPRNDSLTKEAVLQSNGHAIEESAPFGSPMVNKPVKDVPAKEPLLPNPTVKDRTFQNGSLKIDVTQTSVSNGFLKPTLEKGGRVVNERGQINLSCVGINWPKSNANGTANGSIQRGAEDHGQNGISPSFEKAGADCKPLVIPSVERLKQPEDAVASVSNNYVVVGDAKRNHRHKKLLKLPVVASLRVGPKRLFLASLSLRKKKKHKRSKQKISDFKNDSKKGLSEDFTPNDQETSTSARRGEVNELGCTISSKKRKKCRQSNHVKNKIGGSIAIKEGSVRDEDDLPGAVLASDASSAKRQQPAVKESDGRAGAEENRRSVQIGLMSMLMRGLQEATVAQWDDAEPVSCEMNGLEMPHKSSIGYVADEWDEEYDQGKRKKVRNFKKLFDGQNPFQEVAENRTVLKKMKMAGNQPFRI
ncbi:ubiquitin carboxyl-terminal hydrolase 23-like isoform X2 [Aristolochia californica]|uniref:ubiquitin carboxyl-terminal hydrolase 23-like isoform X2 n=1 Tax=Aristolochia californica TaxID=171875 RepID=UPI0035E1B01D